MSDTTEYAYSPGDFPFPNPSTPAVSGAVPGTGQAFRVVQTMTTSADVSGQRVLMFDSNGYVLHADPTSPGYQFAGVSMQAAAAGTQVMACSLGFMADPSWAWLPNQAVFVSPDGVLTQTVPTAGILHRVATSIAATSITIHPKSTIILA